MDPWMKALVQFFMKSGATIAPILVQTTEGPFLSNSQNRIGLIIPAPQVNRFSISHDGPAVLDQGLTVYPGQPTLTLSLFLHGGLVTKTLRAISAGAQQTVWVHEILGPFT